MTKTAMPEPIYGIGDYPSNCEVMCDCYSLEQMEAYAAAKVREALEAVVAHIDSEINENSSLVALATRRNVMRDIQDLFIKHQPRPAG